MRERPILVSEFAAATRALELLPPRAYGALPSMCAWTKS